MKTEFTAWLDRVRKWYHKRQRTHDINHMWPQLRKASPGNIDHAKAMFAQHCFSDPSWRVMGDIEIRRQIGALK